MNFYSKIFILLISRLLKNKVRTWRSVRKKVTAIIGTIVNTASANRQFILMSKKLAPKIRKMEEINEATACATNCLTESMSEVRLVKSLDDPTD